MKFCPLTRELVRLALLEDLVGGDPVSELLFSNHDRCTGVYLARESLTLSGLAVLQEVCSQVDKTVELSTTKRDGESLSANETIATIYGVPESLFAIERVALNFLSHLSGVASAALLLKNQAPESLMLLDTRKTTPGYRHLEKLAAFHGGFTNHRSSLSDLLMIKSNTVDLSKRPLKSLVDDLRSRFGPYKLIEIETRNREEFQAALDTSANIIMLDNMSEADWAWCVKQANSSRPEVVLEVSGGVNAAMFSTLQSAGITVLSTSRTVTQSTWKDISFRVLTSSDTE